MKKFTYLLLFICTSFLAYTQDVDSLHSKTHSCGITVNPQKAHEIDSVYNILKKNLKSTKTLNSFLQVVYVPVKIHIVKSPTTTPELSNELLAEAFVKLNKDFRPMNLQFFMCDDINYITNTNLYDFNISAEQTLLNTYDRNDALNIYFFKTITDGFLSFYGFTYFPSGLGRENRIYMNSNALYVKEQKYTLSHEMGHYFNLYHTFETSFGNELVTRGSGANCSTTGDLLCDTPADKYGLAYFQSSCSYIWNDLDANGQRYQPPLDNIMSYYDGCANQFTAGQYTRMQSGYNIRETLFQASGQYNYSYVPNINILVNDLTAEISNCGVNLKWEDLSNFEKGFIVERATGTSTDFYPVGGVSANINNFFDRDVIAGQSYVYRVRTFHTTTVFSNTIAITTPPTLPSCYSTTYRNTFVRGCEENASHFIRIFKGTKALFQYSPKCANAGYNDNTRDTPILALQTNQQYSYEIWKNNGLGKSAKIYIDFNNDKIFSNSERIADVGIPQDRRVGTFVTPNIIPDGRTRMRITLGEGDYDATSEDFEVFFGTVSIPKIDITNIPAAICAGQQLSVEFETLNLVTNSSTLYQVQLSDSEGNFNFGQILGVGSSSPVVVNIPSNLIYSKYYRIRIVSLNPNFKGNDRGVVVQKPLNNYYFTVLSNNVIEGNLNQVIVYPDNKLDSDMWFYELSIKDSYVDKIYRDTSSYNSMYYGAYPAFKTTYSVKVGNLGCGTILFDSTKIVNVVKNNQILACYPFNGNTLDANGLYNLTVSGNPQLTQDRFGVANKAYLFNGTTDYMSSAANNNLKCNTWTVSAWVSTSIITSWTDATTNPVYRAITHGFYMGPRLPSTTNPNNAIGWYFNGTQSTEDLMINKWVHLVGIYTPEYTKLFVNGKLMNTTLLNLKDKYQSLNQIFIGADPNYRFFGKIDDVKIYKGALTDVDATALYYSTSCDSPCQTIVVSQKNGFWNDASTWNCNRIPTQNDTVHIMKNHTVSVDGTDAKGKFVNIAGLLLYLNNGKISLSN
jgi:Concanavalin A-like lectin/glucanases superfamily/Pregnancy-associated plasma protein-A/GEVED domain